MNNKNQLGVEFFAVLLLTFAVLLSLVIALFVIMNDSNDIPNIDDEPVYDTEDDSPSLNVSLDKSSLFPTVPSRTSYVIGRSANVETIGSEIKSQYTILVDLSTYESVAEKGADETIYPASMTKVMTLVVACENIKNAKTKLTVTEELVNFAAINGASGAGLKPGDSYTVEELLYLIAYQSDTVASHLIAQHVAGSEAEFVTLMNEKVSQLDLGKTRFANCTGLYDDNNYTTCREMAAIMAYALDNDMVYKCLSSYEGRKMTVADKECTFYAGWYSQRFSDNPRFTGGKVIAGKTGYTDESGYTLVSCAEISGKRYINVIVTRMQKDGLKLDNSQSAAEVKYVYKTYS